LTCEIKNPKPFKLLLSGEDMEVQMYKGMVLKHDKSIQKVHTGFVTKIKFTPWDDGAHFITVS
jgi:hypothetical protein